MTAPRLRSRREWAALAERAEFRDLAGKFTVDADGGLTAMFLTPGPRFYVKRCFERFARARGFVLTSVRREPPPLFHPFTGERNDVYSIRLERRQ
jgi:hypothetical protein